VSRAIEWILLGSGSCLAIIYGVRRHRPSRVSPWSLLAGSVAAKALSDFFYAVGAMSASDVCDLAMFVLVAATLLQFTRAGST